LSTPETFSFLLNNLQENWRLSRDAEQKRFVLATVNLLLATALLVMFALAGFQRHATLLIGGLLVGIGVYGVIVNLKLYERSQFHIMRARKLRARLDILCPDSELEYLFLLAEEEQKRAYPMLATIRLNSIWTVLHASIALFGIVCDILSLLRNG